MKHYSDWENELQTADLTFEVTNLNYLIQNFECIDDQLFADAWL